MFTLQCNFYILTIFISRLSPKEHSLWRRLYLRNVDYITSGTYQFVGWTWWTVLLIYPKSKYQENVLPFQYYVLFSCSSGSLSQKKKSRKNKNIFAMTRVNTWESICLMVLSLTKFVFYFSVRISSKRRFAAPDPL